MDTMDNSENNAKISDSGYSNSCHNSQITSSSTKSRHSGSNSSGSSGYGGKHSTSGNSHPQTETNAKVAEAPEQPCAPPTTDSSIEKPIEQPVNVETPPATQLEVVKTTETSSLASASPKEEIGFSCVISMHDGVVMYTTTLTASLGYTKEMWVGRSFINFVHPKDRNKFASQISKELASPIIATTDSVNKEPLCKAESTMVGRVRRYKTLPSGFSIKDRTPIYKPFMMKLSVKNLAEEGVKVTYLVIQATPVVSAYKYPNEVLSTSFSFIIRHSASGHLKHVDLESVPYLGYMPQDLEDMDFLQLFHEKDLPYLIDVYKNILKNGSVKRSLRYRFKVQNGDYVIMETEWSSFVNPWSMKLEFIACKNFVIEGPSNPNVFQAPEVVKYTRGKEEKRIRAQCLRDRIIHVMNEVLTKPAALNKEGLNKRCKDIALLMENLVAEPKAESDVLALAIKPPEPAPIEKDDVMLYGILPPQNENNDSKSSGETSLSYNQMNYNENLQRYFDCHHPEPYEYNTYHIVSAYESNPHRFLDTDSPAYDSVDSFEMSLPSTSRTRQNSARLTQQLLSKHNSEMEKELTKLRRELRKTSKREREKASFELKQKKKEHLARCNIACQRSAVERKSDKDHAHGKKRTYSPLENETMKSCPLRKTRREPFVSTNTYVHRAPPCPVPHLSGHEIVGKPLLYSPISAHITYPPNYQGVGHTVHYSDAHNPLTLTSRNYVEACKHSQPPPPPVKSSSAFRDKMELVGKWQKPNHQMFTASNCTSSTNHHHLNCEPTHHGYAPQYENIRINKSSHDTQERTDGESSYSSFYSSFFRTDSGSAEDSGDNKISVHNDDLFEKPKVIPRRKMDPPWVEHLNMSSDLIYRYQITTKPLKEVLLSDKDRLSTVQQSSVVNEQLQQLYMDLKIDGESCNPTLEVQIFSACSSGEEDTTKEIFFL